MLTTIASFLIPRGVPMRWAKPLIYVVLAVLLIAAALLAKHLYDNHVIEQHEAERAAIVERSARQASEGATAKSDTAREQEALRQAEIAKDAHNAKQSPESNNPAGPVSSAVLERLRRSEEHTSELQSLMRISYAVFCLKKKTQNSRKNSIYYITSNNSL